MFYIVTDIPEKGFAGVAEKTKHVSFVSIKVSWALSDPVPPKCISHFIPKRLSAYAIIIRGPFKISYAMLNR